MFVFTIMWYCCTESNQKYCAKRNYRDANMSLNSVEKVATSLENTRIITKPCPRPPWRITGTHQRRVQVLTLY